MGWYHSPCGITNINKPYPKSRHIVPIGRPFPTPFPFIFCHYFRFKMYNLHHSVSFTVLTPKYKKSGEEAKVLHITKGAYASISPLGHFYITFSRNFLFFLFELSKIYNLNHTKIQAKRDHPRRGCITDWRRGWIIYLDYQVFQYMLYEL